MKAKYVVSLGEERHLVEVDGGSLHVDGKPVEASIAGPAGSPLVSLIINGRSYPMLASTPTRGAWELDLGAGAGQFEVLDEREARIRELSGVRGAASRPLVVKAPMPGMVVKVEVEQGDAVEVGQGLVIVEAMKMENELKSPVAATVARVLVTAGEAVEKDQVLITFAGEVES